MAKVNSASKTQELWRHREPTETRMWAFIQNINKKRGLDLDDYSTLYEWSVNNVSSFWEEVWHFTGIGADTMFKSPVGNSATDARTIGMFA